MSAFVLIGLGGVLGANARFLLTTWAANRFGVDFPYGTFLINVTGSMLVGLAMTLLVDQFGGAPEARLLIVTGFLGAYTTFSTFTYETLALIREAEIREAVINVLGSTLSGIGGCVGGVALAELAMGWIR